MNGPQGFPQALPDQPGRQSYSGEIGWFLKVSVEFHSFRGDNLQRAVAEPSRFGLSVSRKGIFACSLIGVPGPWLEHWRSAW